MAWSKTSTRPRLSPKAARPRPPALPPPALPKRNTDRSPRMATLPIEVGPRAAANTGRSGYAWLAPAVATLVLLLGLPLAATAYLSLSPNVLVQFEGLGLDNFLYLFGKAYYVDVLARTLRISFLVTLVGFLI